MKQKFLLKTMLLLFALVAGTSMSWADEVTLVSGSGTSGYAVPTGWTSTGTVEGGSYLKFDNGTITSPSFEPHTGLSFTYSVATFGSGDNHPLTVRILNASTGAVIVEKTTATPTSSTYINTGSPLSLGDIDVNFKIQFYGPTGKGVRLRNYSVKGTPVDATPACATGIDLTSSKTLTKGDSDDFSATCTPDAGFTGTITYTYESSNTEILNIVGDNYSANGVGAVNVTITATPTGGNAASYKAVTQIVAVTVNGTNSISLAPTSKTVAFSASTFNISATVPTDNYDGTVTALSSNTKVATVSVDGTTITVTPVAVGTATITVTAETGTYYPATANANCLVEFTAPAGGTSSFVPGEDVVFATLDLTDNTVWGFPTDYDTSETERSYSDGVYTIKLYGPSSKGFKFGGSYLIMGQSGAYLTLPAFDKKVTKIDVVGRSGASGSVKQNIYVGSTAVSTETTGATGTNTYAIASEYQAAGNVYTLKVNSAHNTQVTTIKLYTPESLTAKLNSAGYATYCSEYPLDFSGASDYTAWQITGVSGSTITFSKITSTIKGGQGILLMGTPNATITLTSTDSENVLSGNKLVGTTAPTYVAASQYYGLKGNEFVPVSASTVPAGKAILPVGAVGVKAFNFVFEDDADGINAIDNGELTIDNAAIYNLAGQRLSKMQKGINIVNGKKILY